MSSNALEPEIYFSRIFYSRVYQRNATSASATQNKPLRKGHLMEWQNVHSGVRLNFLSPVILALL